MLTATGYQQWRSRAKIFLGGKMFDFRRATVCLGRRLSKHKMNRYAKNSGGMPPWLHLRLTVVQSNPKAFLLHLAHSGQFRFIGKTYKMFDVVKPRRGNELRTQMVGVHHAPPSDHNKSRSSQEQIKLEPCTTCSLLLHNRKRRSQT